MLWTFGLISPCFLGVIKKPPPARSTVWLLVWLLPSSWRLPRWSLRAYANNIMATEVYVASLHQTVVLNFKIRPGMREGLTSLLMVFKGGGCVSFHSAKSTCPFLPTYGLRHANNRSKFNVGVVVNVGTGPIPSYTMALQ